MLCSESNIINNSGKKTPFFLGNLTASDLVLSVEPYGRIDPIIMYKNSTVKFKIRYKDCLYSGISCKMTKDLGDIKLTFNFGNKESWAVEVLIRPCHNYVS